MLRFVLGCALVFLVAGCGDGSGRNRGEDGGTGHDGGTGDDGGPEPDGGEDDGGGQVPPDVAGLFLTADDLDRARTRASSDEEPFATNYSVQRGRAESRLGTEADPFHIDDLSTIRFGWGEEPDGVDDTLSEAQSKFERQSDDIRTFALQYALTGEGRFGDEAAGLLRAWADRHTPVNMYDLHVDFEAGTFDGMTEGFDSDRPWNFGLDAMWQTYGLVNASDAYLLLVQNGYPIGEDDDRAIRDWIREVAEAVNSSFHCWTRWADAHPSSGSFVRYRSDNHLSWSLAGLLAAAAALRDESLAGYVLEGGSWNDGHAGSYANPSHVRDVVDRAIESGTGEENEGRVYEELILRNPPVGYSFFHLWALALVARIAEVHFDDDVWSVTGKDGGGLELAFERYVAFVLGERTSPAPEQEGDLVGQRWMYELVYARWPTDRFRQAVEAGPRNAYIIQSIGPVTLLMGEALP